MLLPLALLILLSSCSTIQKPDTESEPAAQVSENFPLSWTINGRISVIHETENWYARFNWIQQHQDFQIRFTGPLGETELQISQIDQDTLLKTPSLERRSDDIEQLVFQETGWQFPVTSLRYWSQGRPDPGMASQVAYNAQQKISNIHQADWHIQYPERVSVDGYLLPKKIIVTRQGLKIKIIVTQWLLGEAAQKLQ